MCANSQWWCPSGAGGGPASRGVRYNMDTGPEGWRARAWEGGRLLPPFSKIPMTFGLLGPGPVPAGDTTRSLSWKRRCVSLTPPPLVWAGGWGIWAVRPPVHPLCTSPPWGTESQASHLHECFYSFCPCSLIYFSHRPCLLGFDGPVLVEELREVK